jgi:hypothetical protein
MLDQHAQVGGRMLRSVAEGKGRLGQKDLQHLRLHVY